MPTWAYPPSPSFLEVYLLNVSSSMSIICELVQPGNAQNHAVLDTFCF